MFTVKCFIMKTILGLTYTTGQLNMDRNWCPTVSSTGSQTPTNCLSLPANLRVDFEGCEIWSPLSKAKQQHTRPTFCL